MVRWRRVSACGLLLSLLTLMISMSVAQAEELTMLSAINKAGRQRMLTQRMVKAYCQLGLNVRRDEAARQLHEAVELFDTQLKEVARFAPTPYVRESVAVVEEKWAPFKATVTAPYSHAGAARLLVTNEDLLQAAQTVVTRLEAASKRRAAYLVNIAGRQRMLSQRIAKFYMIRDLGLAEADVLTGLEEARQTFVTAHRELVSAPQNTDEINRLLNMVTIQWQLLEYSLGKDQGALAEFVALTTEKILQAMEQVTLHYEGISG